MYYHPTMQRQHKKQLAIGDIVEHRDLPGVALVIVEGPLEGIRGTRWIVQTPDGKRETVLESNLIR